MAESPRIADLDAEYDPFAEDVFGNMLDPHSMLRELALSGPVQRGEMRELTGLSPDPSLHGQDCFLVLGYDEVRQVLNDPATYSNAQYRTGLLDTFGKVLATMDPPEHSKYRRTIQKILLPHVVASWSNEFIEPVVNALIDRFEGAGRCELIAAFVRPFPFDIIYRQLALPLEAARTFQRLSHAATLFQGTPERSREAGENLRKFFEELIRARRASPGSDMISVLALAESDGERLPDEIVVSFFRQLLSAAGDTTFRSTGSLFVALLRDRPDQLDAIRVDRTLVASAIDETLRWDGPLVVIARTTTRAVELGGVTMPKGALVQVAITMANRDPKYFPHPDRFDLTRPNLKKHMAFAGGPHICVGQHLARLEMSRALNIILDRFPKLRLDPAYPPPVVRGSTFRQTDYIYVRFD